MKKERLEMFTDGFIVIIITLMVLEIKLPELDAEHFWLLIQDIGIYALSFVVIAITWVNHHNILLYTETVSTKIIWINFSLLFFLSLVPLATAPLCLHFYKRESHMFYGVVLTLVSLTYTLLQTNVNNHLKSIDAKYKKQMDKINWVATILYVLSIPLSFISIYLSTAIFIMFPVIYFISSQRGLKDLG